MLMMLPSCLVKCAQSLGQLVLQRLESRGAMWPETYPADAHDAPLLPRQMRAITGAVGLQRLESRWATWPEMFPADAHDAPLLPRQMGATTGAVGFATSGV